MLKGSYALFDRALKVSGLGPGPIASHLGVHVRTTQRWRLGQGVVLLHHLQLLSDLVRAKDPGLARELLDAVDEFHRQQSMPLPERADLGAVHNEPHVRLANDLVHTTAKALGVSADKARPALRTALVRAQQGGLTLEQLLRALDRGGPR